MSRTMLVVVLCLAWGTAYAADNRRLAEIFEADQQARSQEQVDWPALAEQDQAHRTEVLALLRANALRTSNDYFNAAIVFQHGQTPDDYLLALSLAQIAATLDPDNKPALWLTAAAMDRLLMKRKLPQWYGTQYDKPTADSPLELYMVDESVVTDEERASRNVPSLQEARARAATMDSR